MLSIIPLPKKAKENSGSYILPKKVKAYSEIELPLLNDRVEMCEKQDADLAILLDESLPEEGYRLTVDTNGI